MNCTPAELGTGAWKPGSERRSGATLLGSLLAATVLAACSGGGGEQGHVTQGARWSDPTTWPGGVLPAANESVHIEHGQTVILDVATPPLDCLDIDGTLVADQELDVAITANCIEVMDGGALEIGSAAEPYPHVATITLTGPRGTHTARSEDNALNNDGVQRAIQVMDGGALRLFGKTPPLLKTRLSAHAQAGATALALADPVEWRAGDTIAVSMTDFYGVGETEVLTLAADSSGSSVQTTSGLRTFRWGRLQYPIDTPVNGSAMSLTPGAFTPASATTPTVLDERAEVVNLSRRIVIQGADDTDWATNGFGVHVMVMGLHSVAQVRGVEIRRCGQRRAMGRYPFHWHMLSYAAANAAGQGGGAYLGDVAAADHFLEDSAIWNSQNRAVTIHGTCGVTVDNVFGVDVQGHAFFLEDGSERRNTLTNCVAMKVRDPGANRLKLHDALASGFWLTNPDNTITLDSGSDCSGRGLWNSFASACFGLSRNCGLVPRTTDLLLYADNTGHSNALQGIATNFLVNDEAGNTIEARYQPASGEFTLSRNKIWKNKSDGYHNRVEVPRYVDWLAADNEGRDFFGVTAQNATLTGALVIGSSLNNATPFVDSRRIAFSSYHFSLNISNITAINYPFVDPAMSVSGVVAGGGVFDQSDMYIAAIAVSHQRNSGWRIINSHPGFLTPAPYFDGFSLMLPGNEPRRRYYSIAGAILDYHGHWGPAGNYLLPSTNPFFTHGLSSFVNIPPAGHTGISTPDLFYGMDGIQMNQPSAGIYNDPSIITMRCGRWNTSSVEVGEHTIGDPDLTRFFPNMRHFTVARNGRYVLTFPDGEMPTTALQVTLRNAYRSTDSVLLALPWSGGVHAAGHVTSEHTNRSLSTRLAAGSARMYANTGTGLVDVINDPTGVTVWQDTANNRIWIKYVGGLARQVYSPDGRNDLDFMQPATIRLTPGP